MSQGFRGGLVLRDGGRGAYSYLSSNHWKVRNRFPGFGRQGRGLNCRGPVRRSFLPGLLTGWLGLCSNAPPRGGSWGASCFCRRSRTAGAFWCACGSLVSGVYSPAPVREDPTGMRGAGARPLLANRARGWSTPPAVRDPGRAGLAELVAFHGLPRAGRVVPRSGKQLPLASLNEVS